MKRTRYTGNTTGGLQRSKYHMCVGLLSLAGCCFQHVANICFEVRVPVLRKSVRKDRETLHSLTYSIDYSNRKPTSPSRMFSSRTRIGCFQTQKRAYDLLQNHTADILLLPKEATIMMYKPRTADSRREKRSTSDRSLMSHDAR